MSNALHDYASLFERYSANNGGTGVILAGEDCLSLANEMRIDADAIDVENAKLRELLKDTLPFIAEESGFCTADCFMYPACCDYDGDEECPAVTRIHERVRELGVEVTS